MTSNRHTGLLAATVGIAVVINGQTPGIRYIAVAVWWLGMLLMINAVIRREDSLRFLLPAGALVSFLVALTPLPSWLIVGHRGLWLAIPAVLARLAVSVRQALPEQPAPGPPANPAIEIANLQDRMRALIEQIQPFEPDWAVEQARLLDDYVTVHGTETAATARRPTAIRNAGRLLAADLQEAVNRLPAGSPAFAPGTQMVRCAQRMLALILI